MTKKVLSALILTTLLFASVMPMVAPNATRANDAKTLVFATWAGMGTKLLDNITTWLTGLGHTCRIASGGVNASILSGADALILSSFYGGPAGMAGIEELNATNRAALYSAISTWFNEGGKFLWASGDSDYDGREWIPGNASKILQSIGCSLRLEKAAIEDPQSNCGGGYRVAANTCETVNPDGAKISQGVNACLFHGPTCVYAVSGGTPVALENVTVGNCFNIYYTGAAGLIVDNTPPPNGTTPVVHKTGRSGHWVMMAGEKYLGPLSNGKAIASGAAPFGDYQPMWTDQYYGVGLEGYDLVKQAILWGLEVEVPTIDIVLILIIAAVIAIIIIIIVCIVVLRRRK